MAKRTLTTSKVFLDTAYAIALSVESDENHERAEVLAEHLEAEQTRLVTTRAILLEIGNALSKKRYRKAAIELLDALEQDPQVEIVTLSEELYEQALEMFRNRLDKQWGLVDCVSFIVMQESGLTEALTTDEHFEQEVFARCYETSDNGGSQQINGREGETATLLFILSFILNMRVGYFAPRCLRCLRQNGFLRGLDGLWRGLIRL